jgi:hypothetical protein
MLTQEQINAYLGMLAEANAKVDGKSGPKLDKIADGANLYRILPEWKTGNPALPGAFVTYARHWVKAPKVGTRDGELKAVTLCEKTYGRPCPVCETYWKVKNMGLPKELEHVLSQSNGGTKYIVNALHRNGVEPNKVLQLELPYRLAQQLFGDGQGSSGILMQWMALTRTAYPLDPNAGTDVIIRKSGSGLGTTYTCELPPNASQPVPAEVMTKLVDLDALVAQWRHTPEEEQTAISTILDIAAAAGFGTQTPAQSQWVTPAVAPTPAPAPAPAPVYQPPVAPQPAPVPPQPQVPVYHQPQAFTAPVVPQAAPFDVDVPASVESAPAYQGTAQPPTMDLDEIRRLLQPEAVA